MSQKLDMFESAELVLSGINFKLGGMIGKN